MVIYADVINYIKASQYAVKRLKDLPLCNRLIKETHRTLMEDVRGEEKFPGEFRRSQNWIGPAGGTLKDARFVPPHPADIIEAVKLQRWGLPVWSGEDYREEFKIIYTVSERDISASINDFTVFCDFIDDNRYLIYCAF